MRLTLAMARIVTDLLSASPDQLYALSISRRTGVANGVLVPRLRQMESAGWVLSTWEPRGPDNTGRPLRRYYTITERGQEELTKLLHRVHSEQRFKSPLV